MTLVSGEDEGIGGSVERSLMIKEGNYRRSLNQERQDEVKREERLSELRTDDEISVFCACSRDEEHRRTDQNRYSNGNGEGQDVF
jgi:hypothetical protein